MALVTGLQEKKKGKNEILGHRAENVEHFRENTVTMVILEAGSEFSFMKPPKPPMSLKSLPSI